MTQEEKLTIIKDYIKEIDQLSKDNNINSDDRLHYKKAYDAYVELYNDVLTNEFDANMLYDSLADFLYVFGENSVKH